MPLVIVGRRSGTERHEPRSVPIVMHVKHGSSKPNRYKPHTGAKEMRKAAARIAAQQV